MIGDDERYDEVVGDTEMSDNRINLNDTNRVLNEQEARLAVTKFLSSIALQRQMAELIDLESIFCQLNPHLHFRPDVIERLCLEIYEEEKAKTKEFFRNYDGQISLSIDMLDYEYMCLTAHFIDENWKLNRWVLHYQRVCIPGDDLLVQAILKCLSDYDIESKISTLTTSTNHHYDQVFQIVKDRIQEKKKLQLNGLIFRVICCADVFSLIVQGAFEKIDSIIDKLPLLIPPGILSPAGDGGFSPGRSCPVWDGTLSHIGMALDLEAMGEYSNPNKDYFAGFEVPSAEEWDKARVVCKLLHNIYMAAYVMFVTKHTTANVCFHSLRELQETLTQESTSSDRFVRGLAKKMLEELNKYCKDMFLVLAIPTVLDPRFKMKYIEFSSSKYKGNDTNSQVAVVYEAIHSMFEGYVIHNPEEEKSVSDSSSGDSDEESPRHVDEKGCKYYNEFTMFQEYRQLMQSTNQSVKSELDCYLEEPVLPWTQDYSALWWWRASSSKYPTLSRMARDILAIPVSLAKSFDAYYIQPREVDPRIKGMSNEVMNAMMCSHSWMLERERALLGEAD